MTKIFSFQGMAYGERPMQHFAIFTLFCGKNFRGPILAGVKTLGQAEAAAL
jgi:hypothetical protein